MRVEDVAAVARGLPEAEELELFRSEMLVFKVVGRVFAILSAPGEPPAVTLKCDPELALELRGRYAAVTPGHMVAARLWNTIDLAGGVPADELAELVRHSWEQAVGNLRKADRDRVRARLDRPAEV